MKRRKFMMACHHAALRGKLARRLGFELRHNPYRGRGFSAQLGAAWADGWREENRDIATAKAAEKYSENLPAPS